MSWAVSVSVVIRLFKDIQESTVYKEFLVVASPNEKYVRYLLAFKFTNILFVNYRGFIFHAII